MSPANLVHLVKLTFTSSSNKSLTYEARFVQTNTIDGLKVLLVLTFFNIGHEIHTRLNTLVTVMLVP